MAGHGTGAPLTLRCAKCKGYENRRGYKLAATGQVRPLARAQRGRHLPRTLLYRAQYLCLECGHLGWSRHKTMEALLAALQDRCQRMLSYDAALAQG